MNLRNLGGQSSFVEKSDSASTQESVSNTSSPRNEEK
jgi:hypothetical protein